VIRCVCTYVWTVWGEGGWDKRRKIKCVPILLSRVKRVDREPKNFSGGRAREDGECWRSERGKGSTQPAAGNKLDQACVERKERREKKKKKKKVEKLVTSSLSFF